MTIQYVAGLALAVFLGVGAAAHADADTQIAAARPRTHAALAQVIVRRSPRFIADRLPIRSNDLARPPLAHLVDLGEMHDSLSLGGGRQNFLTEDLSLDKSQFFCSHIDILFETAA